MDQNTILKKTEEYVRKTLEGEGSGHDWWHIDRVRNLALQIAKEEKDVTLYIVEMAALLHDIGDPKLHQGDTTVAPKLIGSWLDTVNVEDFVKKDVLYITTNLSFSKSLEGKEIQKSKEFMVVQDADRLDAAGAIGIARAFAFGGYKGRIMYDPNVKPNENLTAEEYVGGGKNAPTINHFYEKLLLLKDLMNTETAKKMAEDRHQFMEQYLQQFYAEWKGEK